MNTRSKTAGKNTKSNKLLKVITSRLFVALIVFSVVGWIILFGNNLPSSATPVVYSVVVVSILISVYILWKHPELLRNKIVILILIIFVLVGSIGWINSISEITDCRPYKCSDDFICAKPTELGVKITTGECRSDFSENIDFSCIDDSGFCKKAP